jgi:4-nitrophenyl phosphatase
VTFAIQNTSERKKFVPTLASIKNLILDMDGVLYRGNQALPGAGEFIRMLQKKKIPFLLLTNNSTRTPAQYVAKLHGMGIEVAKDDILTSAQATALYLEQVVPSRAGVYVIGEEGLRAAMLEKGYRLVDEGADVVVVGLDRHLTYDKLKIATLAIRRGALFIGSNPDKSLPTEEGFYPGAGSLLATVEAATNVTPTVIGKPQTAIFDLALAKLGVGKEGTAIVGDRLETDILGGYRANLITILVTSGVTTRQDLDSSDIKPDFVFDDLRHLGQVWLSPEER